MPGPFFQFVPSRGPAGEPARLYASEPGTDRSPATPVSCQEVGCQTEVELRVATHLLTSSTIQNLALQLHGLAECLQELPCNTSYLSPTYSPPVPLFQGPASADSEEVPTGTSPDLPDVEPDPGPSEAVTAAESTDTHSGSVPGFAMHFGWGACCSWAFSLRPSWGVWCILGHRIAFPVSCYGSIISPPGSGSENEGGSASQLESGEDDENLLGDTPDGLRPGDGLHTRPAGPPPPVPVGSPPPPDFYGANLIANASAPPDENYLPGDWATAHVPRSPPPALVVRHVQWRLANFQQCLLNAEVFQDFPVPVGTPFRFHNPFTSRAQCEELRYSVAQGRSPWEVIESHVHNRGWRAVVLLNPQPDSLAVHLIPMPHDWHLVSVALVAGLRIVPCCVPRRARLSDLLAVPIEDVRGRLELPIQVELDHATVTLRSGDCFRVAVHGDPPAPVNVEPILPPQAAAGSSEPGLQADSGAVPLQLPWLCLVPAGFRVLASNRLFLFVFLTLATARAMHRPGGFPWGISPRDRVFQSPEIQGPIQVALHSPFLGSFPAYPAEQGTSHDVAWAQFLNDDTTWAVEFFPVWPGLKFNELTFVPVGADCATVTVILRWRGLDRAALIPRTVAIRWMQEYASAQVCTEVVDVSLPHPLEVWSAFDPTPCDFRLRNGDVIFLHESVHHDPEILTFEDPWDLQEGRAHQHAPWAVGFRLDTSISVRLLRPGIRPYLATVPAGEAWDPLAFSFSGNFVHDHPGRWTPLQWTTAIPPQLLLVSEVAALANVVVSTPEGRRVRTAPRFVAIGTTWHKRLSSLRFPLLSAASLTLP